MGIRRSQSRTGDGNTPVQITSNAIIDWLGYTLPDETDVRHLWEGGTGVEWILQEGKGRHGYTHVFRWQSAELWSGHKNSGPHVDASGHACRDIETAATDDLSLWDWERHLAWLLAIGARCSRLDLAIDVVGGGLDMATLVDAIADGRCKSRWKESSWREMKGIGPNVTPGHTLYMGSPQSSSMLRIYDKRAEQKQPDSAPEWVRVEFQLRHEAAVAMAERIATGGMSAGIRAARSYVDFLGPDGKSLPCWAAAMKQAVAQPLKIAKRGGTLDSMRNWIETQASSALAIMLEADGGDVANLSRIAEIGRERWNAKHKSMAQEMRRSDR